MSKPEDISQEAWDAAWGAEAWARPHYAVDTSDADKTKVVEAISRALMAAVAAEREACAELVEKGHYAPRPSVWSANGLYAYGLRKGSLISAAIRDRGDI